jgi:hypothetical protein
MSEIEYEQHGVKTPLKSKTGSLRPEKACRLFYGIPMGSMLLQRFLRELHSMRHGSSMQVSSPWLKKFSRLGGVQGEEN